MSDRFQDKYRIPSARMRNWDYGWNGLYFITICTAGHDPYFGVIENKRMVLSEIGLSVRSEWEKSFGLRPGLFCDAYVIMPNHIHAILRIDKDDFVETHSCASQDVNVNIVVETHSSASPENGNVSEENDNSSPENNDPFPENDNSSPENNDDFDGFNDFETHSCASLRDNNDDLGDIVDDFETNSCASLQGNKSKFGVARRSPKSISSFVACFKSMVTANGRKINSGFGWQPRFHDHIIRNDAEYQRIANYIENNPANWGMDKYFN